MHSKTKSLIATIVERLYLLLMLNTIACSEVTVLEVILSPVVFDFALVKAQLAFCISALHFLVSLPNSITVSPCMRMRHRRTA